MLLHTGGVPGRPVPRELATPAFVLRTRPYGESDRIVTLMTEQHGKLTGIAKGAKNSRRRFGGTLEPFVRILAVFQQRSASDLVFLLRCELLGVWRAFTRDLDRFAAGSYVLELTDLMVLGREPGREVYRLLYDALALLDGGAPTEPVLRAFELHLLAATGYAPVLDHCRACGAAGGEADLLYLTVERGGFVCRTCVRPGETVRPTAAATVRELARLAASPLADAAAGTDRKVLAEAASVAEQLIGAVASGPIHARELIARARVDSLRGVR
ncbi:MAG TPA: DNA repair protein RecO [Candidatus Binatus sp.]|nr:DNA repair protein RecO [Candidatus Binatus sp.]